MNASQQWRTEKASSPHGDRHRYARHPAIEDISFSNINLTFGGGGTADMAARRDLPNVAGEYFSLGAMPAYGLYARNSRGVSLQSVRFQTATPDPRPALTFDRVANASIMGLSIQSDSAAESALRFIESSDVLITAPRLLTPTAVFLQLEGQGTKNVIVDGGDLSKATSVTALKSGAIEGAVNVRG